MTLRRETGDIRIILGSVLLIFNFVLLTEPFFSECIKIHDQINENLFLGFSAWKWLYWKVPINILPLLVQSNPTALWFSLFRPDVAGFQFSSHILVIISWIFCILDPVLKRCQFKQKRVKFLTNLSIGYFLFLLFTESIFIICIVK